MSDLLIRSFVLRDLNDSLTVAHLSWAVWGNEGMSDERILNPDTV